MKTSPKNHSGKISRAKHYLDEFELREPVSSPINLDPEVLHLSEDVSRGDIAIPAFEEELSLELTDISMY